MRTARKSILMKTATKSSTNKHTPHNQNQINEYINMKTEIWDTLVEHELATEETLRLITKINGWSLDTMESVLYALTGYRDLEQNNKYE